MCAARCWPNARRRSSATPTRTAGATSSIAPPVRLAPTLRAAAASRNQRTSRSPRTGTRRWRGMPSSRRRCASRCVHTHRAPLYTHTRSHTAQQRACETSKGRATGLSTRSPPCSRSTHRCVPGCLTTSPTCSGGCGASPRGSRIIRATPPATSGTGGRSGRTSRPAPSSFLRTSFRAGVV